jgi:hypothetical protein
MAGEQNLQTISATSGVDLTAKQYRFVKIQSTGKLALAGAGEAITGVNQGTPDTDEIGAVAYAGVSFVKLGDDVDPGALVTPDSVGEAVPATTGDTVAGECPGGGSDGDIVPVLLKPQAAI